MARRLAKTQDASSLKHVGECLYRSHSGTYYALVKIAGKQIKRSLKTTDKSLAQRRLAEFRQKAQGLSQQDAALTFDALCKRWLDYRRSELKLSSYNRRVTAINSLLPFFRSLPVRNIGQQQIEAWKIKRSKELSARSFNIELETLQQLLRYAQEDLRIILENPAMRIKRRRQTAAKIVIPNKKQFRKLLEQIRQDARAAESADFVEFLGYSGLRLSEARELIWEDIDFSRGTLRITGGVIGTKNHEIRIIPLFPALKRLLEKIQDNQSSVPTDKIFNLETAKNALQTACKKLKLPHFTHHTMRHFFCSNAIEAGIDFKVIAEWLGHKDGGILVAKTYGHLRAEHSANMAKRMTFDAAAES